MRRDTDKARHFLINELASKCFAGSISPGSGLAKDIYRALQEKWAARLPANLSIGADISDLEQEELVALVGRLSEYKRTIDRSAAEFEKIVPAFGRLENIEIDILTKNFIFEVKAGERPFRSIDFRQLILASAVLHDPPPNVALMNPREGVVWVENLSTFVETVCLRSMSELVPEISYYLSDSGISA